ncbi:MAG: tRNA (adenosine(37)-N6)-threonylcarbamoyltransferase complex dimerization subunit type 1 TsaB [Microbacteriaceae bacterium]|nr:tRNA (adenosine(37)-N6)-threonylcarbamoyltransferase complex dimerization subunit type 1 TsaB [Microbacteriaceae bacterium]
MILAIDTSAGTSVALVGGGIVAEAATEDTRSHAEHIGVFIERVLADCGVTPDAVTAVVVGLGPGPFTGLRVGIAAGITFALGRDVPIHGISSHDAVAVARGSCAVVTDVRRRELAWTTYRDGIAVSGPGLTTEGMLADDVDLSEFPEVRATTISAALLATAALNRIERGDDLKSLTPLYLRAPDATPGNGPKRVSG